MIDFIDAGLKVALCERDVAMELARHFPSRDAAQIRPVADAIAPFVSRLVDALRFVLRASHDTCAGRAVAFANGQILGYVLDDRDLLSEQELGVLGLLDDAYLIHRHAAELIGRYGVLIREGLRVSEALNLTWGALDLEHGVIHLDENKTNDPRDWSLDPGVLAALRIWKKFGKKGHSASDRVFARPDGRTLDRYEAAARLRDCLRDAGVTREQLFERSKNRLALRAHDLRASFVTVSLGTGRSEAWVTDRTGHQSSAMVYEYKREVRLCEELKLGPFLPLVEVIPELAAKRAKGT